MQSNISNSTTDGEFPLYQIGLERAVLCLYIVIAISGTITNGVSISVIVWHKNLRQMPFNMFLIQLLITDFASCLLAAPFVCFNALTQAENSQELCQVNLFVFIFARMLSLTATSEMAILRLICIAKKVSVNQILSKLVLFFMISVNVSFATAISCYRVFFDNSACEGPEKRVWIKLFILILHALILCSTYGWISLKVKKQARRIAPERPVARGFPAGARYDIATIISSVSISASYILCHLPLFIYMIVRFNSFSITAHSVFILFYVQFFQLCWKPDHFVFHVR